MKNIILILVLLSFIRCSNLSPDKRQVEKLHSNLKCYKELVEQIKLDKVLIKEIKKVRDSKRIGKFDPITVKQEFRLIDVEEIREVLNKNWVLYCKTALDKEQDLRGIRLVDKELIIIEIDEFDRHTITESTSRGRNVEFHRIIISNKKYDKSKFYFGTEHIIWRDTLEDNWIYEVTQLNI